MLVASGAMATYSDALAVTGNNIANLNTVGYKESRFAFADLMSTFDGTVETGHGVRLADVSKPFQQGALETTSSTTDLAISGNGFFIVRNPLSNVLYYTRAGQFHLDNVGRLVNDSDLILQGSGGDLAVGSGPTAPAQATSSMALQLNLDAGAAPPAAAFPAGPDASASAWMTAANFSSVTTIYDSLGSAHDLTFVYRLTAPNTWEYRVLAPRNQLDATAAGSTELRQVSVPGTLAFTPAGQFDLTASALSDINGLAWTNGATQTIPAANVNFAGTVQFAQPSFVYAATQNGLPAGTFTGLTIDGEGNLIGRFSNGTTQTLGTIALANFANVDDLDPMGDTLFSPSVASGAASNGTANQNGLGGIVGGTLELSTVDLANQFVALLSSQRAFQVNSRVVTTADQMYAIAAELKG
ncbi:MAG TPA: flagellar hook protein FlgE [Terriglobales bacterium]|nr:flagellar hook protein FlgE [Terriglobales bacterium]